MVRDLPQRAAVSMPGAADIDDVVQATTPPDLNDPALFINRELSWLAFNRRVLAQARDDSHPLLERVKFLAITAANLDEFYMVRIPRLGRARALGEAVTAEGFDVEEQLRTARNAADAMLQDIDVCWHELTPLLAEQGIRFLEPADYTAAIHEFLKERFSATVCPVLTPLAFDPGHPFPHVSSRSKNLAVVVRHRRRTKFARVKVPDTLPRFIELPAGLSGPGQTFVFLEDVIKANLQDLFPGVTLVSAHLFRVVRDAEMVVQERDSADLLESVDRGLRQIRHGALSLLQVERDMPRRVLDILMDNFEVTSEVVTRSPARMGFRDWWALAQLPRPGLKDPPFVPRTLWGATENNIFERLKYQDHLVHHPFDSFAAVEAFIRTAVSDPHVVAIKMTLYRIASHSPVVDLLIEAAEAGKQVSVLVELKARFDERRNIDWARRLEEAGVHVVYGLMNLKTHCKLCLVVRQAADTVERYAHIGTGNYNGVTAHTYTDLGVFTSQPRLMADLSELFNYLTGYSNQVQYRELWVAPLDVRRRLRALLKREAAHARGGRPAHVIIKVNAISDPEVIRDLYRTSQAGVTIDLIVRGICCLRPGVPGVSDNITVRSIVGRFLEHSRILSFENGGDPEVFIGSADLMERNLNRRVETICPIRDGALRRYLRDKVLAAYLRDTKRATILRPDGTYEPAPAEDRSGPFDAQRYLLDHLPPFGLDDRGLPDQ